MIQIGWNIADTTPAGDQTQQLTEQVAVDLSAVLSAVYEEEDLENAIEAAASVASDQLFLTPGRNQKTGNNQGYVNQSKAASGRPLYLNNSILRI